MCHACRTLNVFLELNKSAALWTYFKVDALRLSEGGAQRLTACSSNSRRCLVIRIAIIAGATLAMATAAGAADLPHPQPVYQQPPIGKMPIGKGPIGKSPVGKAPVVSRY